MEQKTNAVNAAEATDLTNEINYIKQIKGAVGEITVKGNDAPIITSIFQALDAVCSVLTDKNSTIKEALNKVPTEMSATK